MMQGRQPGLKTGGVVGPKNSTDGGSHAVAAPEHWS